MTTCEELGQKLNQLTDLVSRLANIHVEHTQIPSQGNTRFHFDEFKINSTESIEDYFNRFKLQLELCNIPTIKWSSHLRVHMGAELNSTLNNLSYPTPVDELNFETIQAKLVEHLVKSKNKYSEAINFRKIFQKQGEPIIEFISRLKAGARYCQFNTFLDYSLIIQFIHGVHRDDIRDEIVSRKPDMFGDVIKIALEMEATREAASLMKPNS